MNSRAHLCAGRLSGAADDHRHAACPTKRPHGRLRTLLPVDDTPAAFTPLIHDGASPTRARRDRTFDALRALGMLSLRQDTVCAATCAPAIDPDDLCVRRVILRVSRPPPRMEKLID